MIRQNIYVILAFLVLFITLFLISCANGDYVTRDGVSVRVRDLAPFPDYGYTK